MPFDFQPSHSDLCKARRARRGQCNNLAGQSAENSVERRYCDSGYTLRCRRWRGQGGEIDLIFEARDGTMVFVEVKKSSSFDRALAMITPRHVGRIHAAAEEYLGTCPRGQMTETRFDAALCDANGMIEIMENTLLGY